MHPNRRRGEISATFDERQRILCLTLGALAELETAFAAADLTDLVRRFSSGRLSATDITRIIGAGLRGAGEAVSDEDVAKMRCDGGVAGAAAIVADLLAQTFGEGSEPANP